LPACGLDLANGVAGQGMAVLQALPHLPLDFIDSKLNACIQILLDRQNKDGSWVLPAPEKEKKSQKLTGFANGAAGILYFLTETLSRKQDFTVQQATQKGWQWLMKHLNQKNQNFGFCDGSSGIALAFVKAYEVFKNPLYKEMAENILLNIPSQIVNVNFTQSWGVAGLGEVYLDAYQVLKTREWQQRADWIAKLFIHTRIQQKEGSSYWLVDNTNFPTADLMTGNGGVIHFLLRYLAPESVGFPLLSS
jgi:hypothetical protein